jgi:lysophospholipase L1-like esterase
MKLQKSIFIILLFLGFSRGFAQDVIYPYAEEIRIFHENDSINPPPPNAILFMGSSSLSKWLDMQDYFPGFTIINRGFGGSTIPDQIHYADDVIFPYSPRQIVIYCGENDLAYNDSVSPEMVTKNFDSLFNLIRAKLPDVKITYISMKPSPSRWNLAEKFIAANLEIRRFIESQQNASFVNVWDDMLNRRGRPDRSLFIKDRLHMKAKGYRIWTKDITPELIN